MPADLALLEIRDLACRRGGRVLLSDLSFTLKPSEVLLLRGPNGSGKTSLLRVLAGLLEPAAGAVLWQGDDIQGELAQHRTRLHFLAFQDALPGQLTALEGLELSTRLLGAKPDACASALARLGLQGLAQTPVRHLSSGQRRRLALARLVSAPRPLWLLDEPLIGLDDSARQLIAGLMVEHRQGGGTAVIASHDDVGLTAPLVLDLAS